MATSRSSASQDPSPNGDVETGLLPPGAEVEVRLDGKGYYGVWFGAIIKDSSTARGRHGPARYSVTFDGDGDVKWFASTHVRPRPPALQSPPHFSPHDVVEAFHERGWWPGIVLSANLNFVTVAFPITREVIAYMPNLVRPRRDYVDGEWVPSQVVITIRPDHEIKRYKVGDEVEVVRKRVAYGHSWFPAKVAKVIDELSYIVEYCNQNGEECGSSEYLHWQFIRPAMKLFPLENELNLGPGAAVQTYCDGAWSAGRVHRINEDGEFVVLINGKQGKQVKTKEVKPKYKWDGKDWNIVSAKRKANFKQELVSRKLAKSDVEVPAEYSCPERLMRAQQKQEVSVQDSENASVSKIGTPLSASEICLKSTCPPNSRSPLYGHSTHPKVVVSDKVQNQLGTKKTMVRKVYSSKKRISKTKEGFEGPHSTGQIIGVNEITWSQREPSIVLERSESTQQQLDSILENAVSANAVKYQEPVGVVPLSFASTSDDIGIHGNKFDERLTAQENKIADTQAPCLLSAVGDMDVLKEFPQQPHFLPLQQYPETIQKGMKLGLKVAFNDCVRRIRKSSIVDNEGSFEEKKSTLAELKKNGFDVQYIECLLDKLIEVKDEYNKHLEEKSAVEAQQEQTMTSLSGNKSRLANVEDSIAELEEELGFLRQKAQHIDMEREHDEQNLAKLKEVESNIKKELDDDERQFNDILAEGQQKRQT